MAAQVSIHTFAICKLVYLFHCITDFIVISLLPKITWNKTTYISIYVALLRDILKLLHPSLHFSVTTQEQLN
jgi:hypothetical protein